MPKVDYTRVEKLLKDGTFVAKNVGIMRSNVWKHFREVHNSLTKEYEGYVICKNCSSVFAHDKKKSGTSRLSNHSKLCLNEQSRPKTSTPQSQSKVTSFYKKSTNVPVKVKDEFNDACIKFVASDMHSFRAIEGQGLHGIVQKSIEIGATYGNIATASILPSKFTVKRKLCDKAADVQVELAKRINFAMKENGVVGFTLDMWTNIKQ